MEHLGLLNGRDATANDDLAGQAEVEEVLLEVGAGGVGERLAVHDECHVVVFAQLFTELYRVPYDHLAGAVQAFLVQDDERHSGVDEPGRVRDVNGRLLLVARQHPDLDVGLQQQRYRLGHTILSTKQQNEMV